MNIYRNDSKHFYSHVCIFIVLYFLQFCRALTPIAWGQEERQEEKKGFLPWQNLGEVHLFTQEGYNLTQYGKPIILIHLVTFSEHL